MPFRPIQNYYDISYRPKKTTQAVPALPTRQSLRIRKKDPSGELLPEPSSSEIYQSVDEHVRSFIKFVCKLQTYFRSLYHGLNFGPLFG